MKIRARQARRAFVMSTNPASLPAETSFTGAAPSPAGGSAERTGYQALALLSFAHFFIDLYSSGLSSFQPLLVDRFGLSLAQAGLLAGMLIFSSSLLQPLYGIFSDKYRSRLFTVLAPGMAGIFIASLGLASGYPMLIAMVLLGGMGIASFHPQASANATARIAENKSRWMAVFISSGTFGMAFGPAFFTYLAGHFGFEMTWLGAIPGVLVTLLLAQQFRLAPVTRQTSNNFDAAALKAKWKPLLILFLLVYVRSIVQMVFAQFLPLYLNRERGFSVQSAALGLTLYLAFGGLGGFVGGNLADRFGGKRVILISMAGCLPFLALFFMTEGWLALASLALAGLLLLFTIPVNLVMGQQLVPSQAGTVSALMMGFAWGSAGLLFIPLVGWAADHVGLGTAMAVVSAFPVVGVFLARMIDENA
ncbi:MAG TPA: MFS transporter [Bryobacteraceae bacterium]|nr:MFS transporter [Bryobacteraceae bacterium]